MAVDGEDVPASINETSEGTADRATTVETEQQRLESLLLDEPDHGQAFEHIAAQEIRVVNDQSAGRTGLLLGFLVLCLLFLGAGYYYLFTSHTFKPQRTQAPLDVSPKFPIPARPKIDIPVAAVPEGTSLATPKKEVSAGAPAVVADVSLFTVMVGPFINSHEVDHATHQLRDIGLMPEAKKGRGPVLMIRLLLGVYPEEEARDHLDSLKKVAKSAFLLPQGDKLAVYAGSFHQQDRAERMQEQLAQKKVNVTLVDSEVLMTGTMLIALQADEKTAHEVATHITDFGLQAQVLKMK